MYINWLCRSGKTRSYNFKSENIDPKVLNYFAVFENVIINDRIDIIVDSNRYYDGMRPDCCNEPIIEDVVTGNVRIQYPGVDPMLKRRYFFNTLIKCLEETTETLGMDPETGEDTLIKAVCDHKLSNILYPNDFVLEPDRNGIFRTGTDVDIVNFDYETEQRLVEKAKQALENI